MFGKRILYLAILPAAIGAPYLLMDNGWKNAAKTQLNSVWSDESAGAGSLYSSFDADPAASLSAQPPAAGGSQGVFAQPPRLEGPPMVELGDVVRFDVSPEWITARWSRVTATLAETDYEGLRVPLVTGMNLDDLAGSLTYYFDKQHRVQRITFRGYTGDAHKLVQFVMSRYRFTAEPTLGAGLYAAKWNGKPVSVLRVSHAPVIRADSPHSRLEVLLEINRPENYCQLSPAMQQLLAHDRGAKRW